MVKGELASVDTSSGSVAVVAINDSDGEFSGGPYLVSSCFDNTYLELKAVPEPQVCWPLVEPPECESSTFDSKEHKLYWLSRCFCPTDLSHIFPGISLSMEERNCVALSCTGGRSAFKTLVWNGVVANWNLLSTCHPKVVVRLMRMGVPARDRVRIWPLVVGAASRRSAYAAGIFERLASLESSFTPELLNDVPRTFPNSPYFRMNVDVTVEPTDATNGSPSSSRGLETPENAAVPVTPILKTSKAPHGDGQGVLMRVLQAYSNFDPGVGYSQGMGFVAALVAQVPGIDAESCFWTFVGLMDFPMYRLRSIFGPKAAGYHTCVYLLDRLVAMFLPEIAMHFSLFDPPLVAAIWAPPFIPSLFVNFLPLETAFRVFDAFTAEGFIVIYRVFLGILHMLKSDLLLVEGSEGFLPLLFAAVENQHDPDVRGHAFVFVLPCPMFWCHYSSLHCVLELSRLRCRSSLLTPIPFPSHTHSSRTSKWIWCERWISPGRTLVDG